MQLAVISALLAIIGFPIWAGFRIVFDSLLNNTLRIVYLAFLFVIAVVAYFTTYHIDYYTNENTHFCGWLVPTVIFQRKDANSPWLDFIGPPTFFAYPINICFFMFFPSVIFLVVQWRKRKALRASGFGFIILAISCIVWGRCDAAITYPEAPPGGSRVAYEHAVTDGPSLFKSLTARDIKALTVSHPSHVYYPGPHLLTGRLLAGATFHAWRYLLLQGDHAVGAVEFEPDGKTGKTPRWLDTEQSFFDAGIMQGIRMASELPQVRKQDYELRFLEVPNLLYAIWLHGKADDIIIPLPPTYRKLIAYHPYSERQIMKVLKPVLEMNMKSMEEAEKAWKKAGGPASGPPPVE